MPPKTAHRTVASVLRQPERIEARQGVRAGRLSDEGYCAVEERAVAGAWHMQEARVDVTADGEVRRDFIDEFRLVAGTARAVRA
jgi:methionine synthase II (cobalamin-independent)